MKWIAIVFGSCLLVILLTMVALIHEPRRHQRLRSGRCTRCGYDMLHAEHEACPECGHCWFDD